MQPWFKPCCSELSPGRASGHAVAGSDHIAACTSSALWLLMSRSHRVHSHHMRSALAVINLSSDTRIELKLKILAHRAR